MRSEAAAVGRRKSSTQHERGAGEPRLIAKGARCDSSHFTSPQHVLLFSAPLLDSLRPLVTSLQERRDLLVSCVCVKAPLPLLQLTLLLPLLSGCHRGGLNVEGAILATVCPAAERYHRPDSVVGRSEEREAGGSRRQETQCGQCTGMMAAFQRGGLSIARSSRSASSPVAHAAHWRGSIQSAVGGRRGCMRVRVAGNWQ